MNQSQRFTPHLVISLFFCFYFWLQQSSFQWIIQVGDAAKCTAISNDMLTKHGMAIQYFTAMWFNNKPVCCCCCCCSLLSCKQNQKKWKHSNSSDSDSWEFKTLLMIFYFRYVISTLMTSTTTPTASLVKISLKRNIWHSAHNIDCHN